MTVEPKFDELIHPSTRLSIVALLASADWIDFAFVRDRLNLSDSALSKQFATLEEAGYVSIERPLADRRRRVRARLTPTGKKAFDGHVAALQAVLGTATATL
jgi:DNA-binding MarR family transcriptional regulator